MENKQFRTTLASSEAMITVVASLAAKAIGRETDSNLSCNDVRNKVVASLRKRLNPAVVAHGSK